MLSPHDERRTSTRIGFRVPANITIDGETKRHRGYVLNLSELGAFVMMDADSPLETNVHFSFRLPEGSECQAWGRLARVMPMGKMIGFGVEITHRNDSFIEFIEGLARASDVDMLDLIREMGRIGIWVGAEFAQA